MSTHRAKINRSGEGPRGVQERNPALAYDSVNNCCSAIGGWMHNRVIGFTFVFPVYELIDIVVRSWCLLMLIPVRGEEERFLWWIVPRMVRLRQYMLSVGLSLE